MLEATKQMADQTVLVVDDWPFQERFPRDDESRTHPATETAEYLSLPPTRHDLTQGQKPEGRLKWG